MSEVKIEKALILTDAKAGHENQSKAFARGLGFDFDLCEVRFRSPFAKALSYLLDHLGVRTTRLLTGLRELPREPYAAVIGTGSGTFYAVKAVAKRLGVPCGVVLYPRGYRLGSFTCILAPAFDRPRTAKNIIPIPANLVANDGAFYDAGVAAFRARHAAAAGKPAVAVIIGGPNKCSTLSPEWMQAELKRIFAENAGAEFWVTTSRRTPPAVEEVVASFPWDFQLLYSQDHFNPIPAFVKLAKRLYVTAESTGMLSEACTFGAAEVFALDNLNPGPHKFRRFVEDLKREGYVDGCRKVELAAAFARARTLMRPRQVRGIVFDFGGVMTATIMPERVHDCVEELGLSWPLLVAGFEKYRRLYDGGFMTLEELYAKIWADGGVTITPEVQARLLEADTASWLYRNERTRDWMANLKARGYRIGILTNMAPGFADLFRKNFADFIATADAVVISGEERLYKPQREIYELLERRIGLKGEELVFVDDSPANCAGAEAVGWQTVRFAGNDAAAAELERILAEGVVQPARGHGEEARAAQGPACRLTVLAPDDGK